MNIEAGGEGLDGIQQVCQYCIFVEFDQRPHKHEQAEGRLRRVGQTADHLIAYYLILQESIEEKMLKKLDIYTQSMDEGLVGRESDQEDFLEYIYQNSLTN